VRVDIRSETQVAEGVPAGGYADDVEYAEGEWVANAETGELEWHAADGSVMSQAEWVEQLGGGPATESNAAVEGEANAAVETGAVESDGDAAAAPEASETPEGDGAPQ